MPHTPPAQALAALGPETAHPGLAACPGLGLKWGVRWWVQRPPSSAYPPPRAAKQRRKGDRLVIACQEQTYWLVNRPPVSPLWGVVLGQQRSPASGQCASSGAR